MSAQYNKTVTNLVTVASVIEVTKRAVNELNGRGLNLVAANVASDDEVLTQLIASSINAKIADKQLGSTKSV